MTFGLYEHIVICTTITLLVTRKTKLFYLSVVLSTIFQIIALDYLRFKKEEVVQECTKHTFNVLGRVVELCISVKRANEVVEIT